MKRVAFIPARSGSKRIKDKNIRSLNGHPLIAYSIRAAIDSELFDSVVVCTDSDQYAEVARGYGADVPFLRPAEISGDKSPDIEWVEYMLRKLKAAGQIFDIFSILRPTSPFRTSGTIKRAFLEFEQFGKADSLRAVERCKQHPGKMWVVHKNIMTPILPINPTVTPWHSSQLASLPVVFIQNASLEIARAKVVFEQGTISGEIIMPFFTQDHEGLDVNEEFDWWRAEYLLKLGEAFLPKLDK